MRWPRLSLRSRITAGALMMVIAALSIAGIAVTSLVTHAMRDQIDDALRAEADYAQRSFTSGLSAPPVQGPNGLYVQLVDPSTERVIALGSATKGRPPLTVPGQGVGSIRSVNDPTLGPVRSIVVAGPPGSGTELVLARSSQGLNVVASQLTRLVIALIVGGAVLLGVVIWWVVSRALRPVEQMRARVDDLRDSDLTRRIELPGTRDELDRLAVTLNDLLQRLEQAIERERRFVADASHDLRTPVAALKMLVETDAPGPGRGLDDRDEMLARIEELQDLIDRLLELSTIDHAERRGGEPVDLDDLVLTQAARLARNGRLRIDTSGVSGGQIAGDDTDVGRIVANLAANAARYASSTVRFGVSTLNGTVLLRVEDDGPGIPSSDRERIFERFATLDDARNHRSGAGLGLAITAGLVALHHGSILVTDAAGGGACFIATFPSFGPSESMNDPVGVG